jgi:hypothetical protein
MNLLRPVHKFQLNFCLTNQTMIKSTHMMQEASITFFMETLHGLYLWCTKVAGGKLKWITVSRTNSTLKEFYISTYVFMPEFSVEQVPQIPSYPMIVFINTKGGGQLGHDLVVTYRKLLNHARVHIFKVTRYTCLLLQHLCIFTAELNI